MSEEDYLLAVHPQMARCSAWEGSIGLFMFLTPWVASCSGSWLLRLLTGGQCRAEQEHLGAWIPAQKKKLGVDAGRCNEGKHGSLDCRSATAARGEQL